jgi:hypothetical protein
MKRKKMKKKFLKFFEKSASRRTLVNVKFLCVVTDRQTDISKIYI